MQRIRIAEATPADHDAIAALRHQVYAEELGQYASTADGRLRDDLSDINLYIKAVRGDELLGFVSITPPGPRGFALDRYIKRDRMPFAIDDQTFEVRALTVASGSRGGPVALPLIYAAYRYVLARGGTSIVAMGRADLAAMYESLGLDRVGVSIQAGAVTFEVMRAALSEVPPRAASHARAVAGLHSRIEWDLPTPLSQTATAFHGGAFFEAIGDGFDDLERRHGVVNADVLDAWFAPASGVLQALIDNLEWLARTSPPTHADGLVRAIAQARGVPPDSLVVGAGSSALIFLALRHWLSKASRVLILDPAYGEYAHVLESVIGCQVDRMQLRRANGYSVDLAELERRLQASYDLVVLVNPNNPTGGHIERSDLERLLQAIAPTSRVWVDETYVDYRDPSQSLEAFASTRRNVVVCKSMSKAYALSGLRVGYLCTHPSLAAELRVLSPPWAVSLPAQVAAVKALEDRTYYRERYRETASLRRTLCAGLVSLGLDVVAGVGNFVLFHLPEDGPAAETVEARCRAQGIFIRVAGRTSAVLGPTALRIAVKDAATNERVLRALRDSLRAR